MPVAPLWDFGFGLSYTSYEYSNLQITPNEIGTHGEVTVKVDVKNVGSRKGKEVVQLYISDKKATKRFKIVNLIFFTWQILAY